MTNLEVTKKSLSREKASFVAVFVSTGHFVVFLLPPVWVAGVARRRRLYPLYTRLQQNIKTATKCPIYSNSHFL